MKELFASADAGLIGLIFFFVYFCIMVVWTFRPGAKKRYDDNADIPFNEDKNNER